LVKEEAPPVDVVGISPKQGAAMLGISLSTFARYIMPHVYSNEIQSIKLGTCRIILKESLKLWIENQASVV
jgi:hypothetical protein